MQTTVMVDQKGRVILPKKLRDKLKIKQGNRFVIESSNSDRIIFKMAKDNTKSNRLLWDLKHPLHVDKKRLSKINLDKIEEEMWLP